MKRLWLILITFSAVLGFIVGFHTVHASTVWSNQTDTDTLTATYGISPFIFVDTASDRPTNATVNQAQFEIGSNANGIFASFPLSGSGLDCQPIVNGTPAAVNFNFQNSQTTDTNTMFTNTSSYRFAGIGFFTDSGCTTPATGTQITFKGKNMGSGDGWQEIGITANYFKPWFAVGTNIPFGSLSITNPPNNSSAAIGTFTFSGTCQWSGSHSLNLSLSDFNSSPTNIDQFDIECVNYSWSKSFIIRPGIWTYTIHDQDCLDTSRPIPNTTNNFYGCYGAPGQFIANATITGIDTSNGYFLSYTCPGTINGQGCENLQASTDWVFQFKYEKPTDVATSAITLEILDCGTTDWSSCPTSVVSDTLNNLDPGNSGLYETTAGSIQVENGVKHFYTAGLSFNSSVKYRISFYTLGTTSSGAIAPVAPGLLMSCGWAQKFCDLIRYIIVPSNQAISSLSNIPDLLKQKSPFGYFYEFSTVFNSFSADNTPFIVNVPIQNTLTNSTMNITVIDSSTTLFHRVTDIARPYMVVTFWIVWIFYLWDRLRHLDL